VLNVFGEIVLKTEGEGENEERLRLREEDGMVE